MTSPKEETNHDQDVQHLFRAIRRGKAHLTRFMLAASNNSLLNCLNADGKTPLIECCYIKEEAMRGHMVRVLKDAGADVNMKDRTGKTALIHACEQKCNDVVKILIQHANICPDVEDIDGNTALIHSAKTGNDIALEMLVKSFRRLGLNVDHFNRAGYTALHVATTNGFLQCAKVLAIKGRASLTLKDKVTQLTPLEWCLNEGYEKSEVDFLKPSVKFYRVAKLTTTMAKCRKKSTQESLPSSETSHLVSPVDVTEKPTSKIKGFLRKDKTKSPDGTGFDDKGGIYLSSCNKPAAKVHDMSFQLTSLEISRSSIPDNSNQRNTLDKSRQRRFSQSEQLDESQEGALAKVGLPHSRSHPITCRDLEINAAGHVLENINTMERYEHRDYVTLPNECGESDVDNLETFLLDTNSTFEMTTTNENNTVSGRVDGCHSVPNQGRDIDNTKSGHETRFHYGTSNIQCYVSPTHSGCNSRQCSLVGDSSCARGTLIIESKELTHSESIPFTVNANCIKKQNNTTEDNRETTRVISGDMHPRNTTKKDQPTQPDEHLSMSIAIKPERSNSDSIQSTWQPLYTGHCRVTPVTENERSNTVSNCPDPLESTKKTISMETSIFNKAQRNVSMYTIPNQMCNVMLIPEVETNSPDRNVDTARAETPYKECGKPINSPGVPGQSQNSLSSSKPNGSFKSLTFLKNDLASPEAT